MLVLAAVLALVRARRDVLVCVAIAAGIGVLYLFLPYTAQGVEGQPVFARANSRYVVPALLLAVAVGAWAAGQAGRARPLLELLALVAFLDALRKNTDFSEDVSALALALAALAFAVFGAIAVFLRRRPGLVLPAAGCAALLALPLVYAQEERFNDQRYAGSGPPARWVRANAPSGATVGVAGEGFVLYQMFGPRLENEVRYIGPSPGHMLRPYEEPAEFEAAVRKGRYDLVLVQDNEFLAKAGLVRRQEESLQSLGYRPVASGSDPQGLRDQHQVLYRR
jgi:hypothetical protein